MRACIVCRIRKPAVPDRNVDGRPIKRLCLECHQGRLKGDIEVILRGATKYPDGYECQVCGTQYAEYVNGCVYCSNAGICSGVFACSLRLRPGAEIEGIL